MSQNLVLAYRPDIDGLRAIAVLAVVFYHFGVGGISGGFVGVDVFFVISGYLITGIIQREIEQDRFTFAGFYERRIRRIFPALFLVLVITLAIGTIVLLPTDLILLGKSTIATLLFSSNIFFWRTSGYFDGNSELNPLLHTWSLAVEEQFYIGLPILLLLVYRYARDWLKPVLIASAILSFAACLWIQDSRPTATFYLSPFRAWELLIGSYLAVGKLPRVAKAWLRELVAWLGLALLAVSIIFIKASPEFPGWQALGPVLGTALLIYAGSTGKTTVSAVLSVKPVVFIGLISYSLYLWHWPVVVYAKYVNGLEPLGAWAWAGVALSVFLATASYYWVETPFRMNKKIFNRPLLFAGAIASTIALIAIGGFAWQSNGMPKRFSNEVLALDAERNPYIPFQECDAKGLVDNKINPKCILGDKTITPSIIVWGDSHALALAPVFDVVLMGKKKSAILMFTSNCPPLVSRFLKFKFYCQIQNRKFITQSLDSKQIDTIIMAASWLKYFRENNPYSEKINNTKTHSEFLKLSLMKTILDIQNQRKKIVLFGPIPRPGFNVPLIMALSLANRKELDQNVIQTREYIDVVKIFDELEENTSLIIYQPHLDFCSNYLCKYESNGFPLYRDDGHINVRSTLFMRNRIEKLNL